MDRRQRQNRRNSQQEEFAANESKKKNALPPETKETRAKGRLVRKGFRTQKEEEWRLMFRDCCHQERERERRTFLAISLLFSWRVYDGFSLSEPSHIFSFFFSQMDWQSCDRRPKTSRWSHTQLILFQYEKECARSVGTQLLISTATAKRKGSMAGREKNKTDILWLC